MIRRAWAASLGLLLVLNAAPIAAQDDADDEPDYNRDGWYWAARGGLAFENFENREADESNVFTLQAAFGYRFLEYLGAELHFDWLDDLQFDRDAIGVSNRESEAFSIGLGTRMYPLGSLEGDAARVQPYGLVGADWMWVRRSGGGIGTNRDGSIAGRFGAGVDVYLTESLVLTGESSYVLPSKDISSFDYFNFGVGLAWRFAPSEYY